MRKKYKMFVFFLSVGIMMIGCVTFYIGKEQMPSKRTNTEIGSKVKDDGEVKNEQADNTGEKDNTKPSMSSGSLNDEGDIDLEENAYPEINEVVEKYLNYSVIADVNGLSTVVSNPGRIDKEVLTEKYRYVDEYKNIICYTIKSPEEGGYRVYAYAELKLSGIDTLAPGLSSLYVTQTDKGDYCVYLDVLNQKVQKFIDEADESEPVKKLVEQVNYRFEEALGKEGMSFICEVKKASPSKGIIAEHFPYEEIAVEYEKAGADAISILTEPFYFKGSNDYLTAIRKKVQLPLLRKDFTVDEYMLYEAKKIGADAVLLICAILSPMQLAEYRGIAEELGLSALVEAHDENEVEMALKAGARVVGVNNRNLKDFTVDISNSVRLRELVPRDILFVSESGMKTRADIARLEENGTDAVLIGETFMRSGDKARMLKELRG